MFHHPHGPCISQNLCEVVAKAAYIQAQMGMERLSYNGLSLVMKDGCTTMNLQGGVKAWGGNMHHGPGPRNSKVYLLVSKVILTLF
jgi:hypothetical protein